MAVIFQNYDEAKTAFLNPDDFLKPIPDFPEVCVTTFSENIIQKFAGMNSVKEIAKLYSANGLLPIYEISYAGTRIAFFLSRVGAPACVAGLEEIIAYGARKIVLFGCCGVLNEAAVQNKIIIPTAAIRDEGTSYHYLPASEEICADEYSVKITEQCMDRCGMPFVKGKVWTTDAIYRETRRLVEERKQQGCLGVEMECAAVLAVAQFREVPLVQFFYGADSLDSEKWEPRDLTEYGLTGADKYMALALECAVSM